MLRERIAETQGFISLPIRAPQADGLWALRELKIVMIQEVKNKVIVSGVLAAS